MNHRYGGNIWANDSNGDQRMEHESISIPPRRYWGDVVYDSNRNRIVMFGGHGATEFDDTWAFDIDKGDWEQASGDTRPVKRVSSNMAYDPEYDVLVMFGGIDQTGSSLSDNWIMDAETLTWSMAEDTAVHEDTSIPEDSTGLSISGYPIWTTLGSILLVVAYWTRNKHWFM